MPSDPLDGIPLFLRIPQDQRAAAWERYRAEQRVLIVEAIEHRRRIPDLPTGTAPHDDT